MIAFLHRLCLDLRADGTDILANYEYLRQKKLATLCAFELIATASIVISHCTPEH